MLDYTVIPYRSNETTPVVYLVQFDNNAMLTAPLFDHMPWDSEQISVFQNSIVGFPNPLLANIYAQRLIGKSKVH